MTREVISGIVAALTVVACGTPTTLVPDDLPVITLSAGTQHQVGRTNTYCWHSAQPPCADGFVAAATDPIVTKSAVTLSLRIRSQFALYKLVYTVISVAGSKVGDGMSSGLIVWNPPYPLPTLSGELPVQTDQDFNLALDPGEYVISIGAYWGDAGASDDTFTEFHLRVQP